MEQSPEIILGENSKTANKNMYIFSFSGPNKDKCREMFDGFLKNNYISYWRTDMSNSFYIVSTLSAEAIRDRIHECFLDLRFLVVKMDVVCGWITKESWIEINKYANKKPHDLPGIVDDNQAAGSEIEI